MPYKLLDGKTTAAQIKKELMLKVKKRKDSGLRPPHLAAILVGDDDASVTYVKAKVKACKEVGFESTLVKLEKTVSETNLLTKVTELNDDPHIDGFIVQVPLPKHISEQKVVDVINPKKDVDGFHPVNMGKMLLGLSGFIPATPLGINLLLTKNGISTSGKHCVVMGRSRTVGTPVSILMSRNNPTANSTVTVVHSRTQNMSEITRQADILIVATGKPEMVTKDMIKEGAVVIDVGIHRVVDNSRKSGFRLKGDVNFEEVAPKCSYISPVPGGVGPMTIVSLLHNTMIAAEENIS